MIRALRHLLNDLRAGRALRRLHDAKRARGVDFTISSSWCSDYPLIVVLVRAPGARLGKPLVSFDLTHALENARP